MGKWKWDRKKGDWTMANTMKIPRNSMHVVAEGKRKRVHEFICNFIDTYRYSPSVRDISDGCGLPSTSHVHGILTVLRDRGYITYVDGLSRTIVVLRREWNNGSNSV